MKHIFIVEDDRGILDGLTFLLAENYQITAISDPRMAVEKIQQKKPDLILIDLLMPHLSGAELIKQITPMHRNLPILVMSASSNVENQLKGLKIAGIVRKPFEIEEMEMKIAELLN